MPDKTIYKALAKVRALKASASLLLKDATETEQCNPQEVSTTCALQNEAWKDIAGYEGFYQVSNRGQIKSMSRTVACGNAIHSLKSKIKSQSLTHWGYKKVELSKDGKSTFHFAHRLVAEAFIPKTGDAVEINHIDGDKTNNSIENLEWVTKKQNMQHARDNGLMNVLSGEKHPRSKKVIDLESGAQYNSITEAAKATQINFKTLYGYLTGSVQNKTSLRFKVEQ